MIESATAWIRIPENPSTGLPEHSSGLEQTTALITNHLSVTSAPRATRRFWSSFSPVSVVEYLATWQGIDVDRIRVPFDEMKGHRAFNGSKNRNDSLFEQRFRPYFVQCGAVLEAASRKGRGLVISFH